MSGSKTNIFLVKSFFNSLSPKDLKITIEKSNQQITEAITKLSKLFSKPREFTTTGYSESNRLINSITQLKENISVNSWIEELSELDNGYLKEEHFKTFNGSKPESCNTIIHRAVEIKEKFKNDYSEIIKEIQYHDITKQKLEHVIEINNDILKEIEKLDSLETQENETELKYLRALKEIINIEIAQLIYSSELCNSAIKKIVDAIAEQKIFIDKTKSLSNNLKERLSGILNLIHTDENISGIVESNKELFKSIHQLNPDNAKEEFQKLLPDNTEFENLINTYSANLEEIEVLSTSGESFYETIKNVNEELTSIRVLISEDGEKSDKINEVNLDFLKMKYTMNSERKIHELALENNLIKDFFSEMDETADDDNDVEFF